MYNIPELQQLFLDYMDQNRFNFEPRELYEPVDYILHLGGKRLRPVLVLMGANLYSEEVTKALPLAYSVEIFHNFSLVHDDIMDEAPLRRGKPSVHAKYDINTGILSGDVMLVHCYEYLRQADDHILAKVLETFNRFAIDVCEGQQYDMNFETAEAVTMDEYINMIRLKTGALIRGCLKMGALVGNASDEDIQHLCEFGEKIGIAFQLQDDILDTFGDPKKFGKKVGGDIAQNKKTYLLLKTLELADEATKKNLYDILSKPTTDEAAKIETVRAIYRKYDIEKIAEAEKMKYLNDAYEHLNQVSVAKERKTALEVLAKTLIHREV